MKLELSEVVQICKFVSALSPQQAFDDDTPLAWYMVLAEYRFVDATEALKTLGKSNKYIAPSDVIAEIKRIRSDRIQRFGGTDAIVPNVHPDDVGAYMDERRAIIKSIADGEFDELLYKTSGGTLTGWVIRRTAVHGEDI